MKKYITCTVQYHVQFQAMTEKKKSCYFIKALHKQYKTCYCYTFYNENHTTYLSKNCNKKFSLLKISDPIVGIHQLLHSSCCFLNTNTAITRQVIRTARRLEAEWRQVCGEAWVRGQRKTSQALGVFGLLDFTTLRSVLDWRAFRNLQTAYFFNFPNIFQAAVNRG
jgi:hypothetical protein